MLFILLKALYASILVSNYGYSGFDNDYNFGRNITAWALYIVVLLLVAGVPARIIGKIDEKGNISHLDENEWVSD